MVTLDDDLQNLLEEIIVYRASHEICQYKSPIPAIGALPLFQANNRSSMLLSIKLIENITISWEITVVNKIDL